MTFTEKENRPNQESVLTAEMQKAVSLGQSQITGGKIYGFWVRGQKRENPSSLRAEYNRSTNYFCWNRSGEKIECFQMKEASLEFAFAIMKGACNTAKRDSQTDFYKKYCLRREV